MTSARKAQAGLSLIELMVALTLSCFLILGVTQFFIDNKRTYLFQQAQASNLNKSRFANLLLEQMLARTGYRATPWISLANSFPVSSGGDGCPSFAAGETLKANSAGSGICMRYQSAGDAHDHELDCLGADVSSAGTQVLVNLDYDADTSALTCTVGGETAVLVDHVAGFVIGELPSSAASSQAVRFALLLSNGAKVRGGVESDVLTRWNQLSGQSLSTDSQQAYQIAQGSVTLRNLMQ